MKLLSIAIMLFLFVSCQQNEKIKIAVIHKSQSKGFSDYPNLKKGNVSKLDNKKMSQLEN